MHKTIGILGGMSPESTVEYYLPLTHAYIERFGDYAYPEIIIFSVSFQAYVDWPRQGRWDLVAQGLSEAARKLEAAGAEFIVIATNTMHIVEQEIRQSISIPVLSLLDVVAQAIIDRGIKTVGLLGTEFTMEHGFYQSALAERGIEIIIPEDVDRKVVNDIIYDELIKGVIRDDSRNKYIAIIDRLAARGAQGIILGCTEIPLLIGAKDTPLPLFNTTALHVQAALDYALDES